MTAAAAVDRRAVLKAAMGSAAAAGVWALGGCDRKGGGPAASASVTLYTAVDRPVAEPIVRAWETSAGVQVNLVTDAEKTKTAGLAARLEAEKADPRCDVWWSNEVFHTINLAAAGVLAPTELPAGIPAMFKDPGGRWGATALRARVIGVSTREPGLVGRIKGLRDLLDPSLRGKVVMARPSAGTTAGHVAALLTLWGRERAEAFFKVLVANDVKLVDGNATSAEQVGLGTMLAGLTDNDDVDAVLREGGKIAAVLPDQQEGGDGTLVIPCTAGIVAGAKNPEPARRLLAHLLSPEVERKLIEAKFAAYSVFESAGGPATGPAAGSTRVKPMAVDYAKVAANLRSGVELALTILEGR